MKKIVAAFLAAVSMTAAASALDFDLSEINFGVGALFDYTFNHQFGKQGGLEVTSNSNLIDFKAFFDAQYAQIQLGMSTVAGKTDATIKSNRGEGSDKIKIEIDYFNIGLFGKYPLEFGSAKIYPMFGFDFDIALKGNYKGWAFPDIEKYNDYWVDAGVGADIFIKGNLYIKPQLLLGLQMNKIEHYANVGTNAFKVNAGIGAGVKF